MNNSEHVSTLLVTHFKLNFEQYSISEEDKEDIEKISYAFVFN